MTYKLSAYEGPLDLLYQLIQEQEINICDIPVSELADQYLEFISKADTVDMESMSEFVYMAATLLEIKSRMLLPTVQKEKEDPRKELVDKLLEYERMKIAAGMLMALEEKSGENFYKKPETDLLNGLKPKETIDDILDGVTLTILYRIYNDVMSRRELKVDRIRSSFRSVSKELFPVEDKIVFILDLLSLKGVVSLYSLIGECEQRAEMIAVFLAVLELTKKDSITADQLRPFGDIIITLANTC